MYMCRGIHGQFGKITPPKSAQWKDFVTAVYSFYLPWTTVSREFGWSTLKLERILRNKLQDTILGDTDSILGLWNSASYREYLSRWDIGQRLASASARVCWWLKNGGDSALSHNYVDVETWKVVRRSKGRRISHQLKWKIGKMLIFSFNVVD